MYTDHQHAMIDAGNSDDETDEPISLALSQVVSVVVDRIRDWICHDGRLSRESERKKSKVSSAAVCRTFI